MDALTTVMDVLMVVIGFGLIIFVHELGHFLAAKWARIRVLAFALGFGPAIASYRRGLGFRWGSSAREYARLTGRREDVPPGDAPTLSEDPCPLPPRSARSISPTEYRLNWLPLGGYVKMLGQEDDDPTARSSAPDSYQMVKPWKRMVVISAGVFMNLLTAAVLLTIVFSVGLRSEPAKIGSVSPFGAAAGVMPVNARSAGVTEPGLQPGDLVLTIDGEAPRSFNDLRIAAAMASGKRPLEIIVRREGFEQPLRFLITPGLDAQSRLLALGVGPWMTPQVSGGRNTREAQAIAQGLEQAQLKGVLPGSRLVRVGALPGPTSAYQVDAAARVSGGRPVDLVFQTPEGREVPVSVQPEPEFQVAILRDQATEIERPMLHLLGVSPLMKVASVSDHSGAQRAGLKPGDVITRVGDFQFPSLVDGVAEIRRRAGSTVDLTVLRQGAIIELRDVDVSREGVIGFGPDVDLQGPVVTARWPAANRYTLVNEHPKTVSTAPVIGASPPREAEAAWSGSALSLTPGSRIVSVNDRAVATWIEFRAAVQESVRARAEAPVRLGVVPPRPAGAGAEVPPVEVAWTVPASEAALLQRLAWSSPLSDAMFEPERILLRGDTPGAALAMGLHEFKNTMLQTYLTFARLFQGTVRVEHLKGPVGIAHVGTLIADRGFNWLLFFLAVISINLAVINFLPLPVVDGGHMVFLIYEQVTGKPVSPGVQGAATLAALALIGSMFLIVTYNDIANLLWR